MTRTYSPKRGEIERDWYVVDAAGLALGRLSSEVAKILRGKHKPTFTPHIDTGDFVIVVNAEKVALTGRKAEEKIYRRHSGRPGSLRSETAQELLERHPERVLERAVKGMLPKTRLGRRQLKKLKVYKGPNHPHQAQQPSSLELAV